jgi:hypothetical protein
MPGWLISCILASAPTEDAAALAARIHKDLLWAGLRPETRVVWNGGMERYLAAVRAELRTLNVAMTEGASDAPWRVDAWLSARRGRPLAVFRVIGGGAEVGIHFADAGPNDATAGGPAAPVTLQSRLLVDLGQPVVDAALAGQNRLIVLLADRLLVYALTDAAPEVQADLGLQTGADRLRDPLARLRIQGQEVSVYSAAHVVGPSPPLPVDGYTVKVYGAATPLPGWPVRFAAGRNYFQHATAGDLLEVAPLGNRWVTLDLDGRLALASSDLRVLRAAPGEFDGGVATLSLPCGFFVLAGTHTNRLAVLRAETDRLHHVTDHELPAGITRLVAGSDRALAVTGSQIQQVELTCR